MRVFIWCLLVLGTLSLGCEHVNPLEPGGLEPTLSGIQMNIFDRSCAISGCHIGSGAPRGLDLSEDQAHDNLVNVRSAEIPNLFRVEPGDPDNSYLVMKVEGAPGIVGARMPLTGDVLTQEEINTLRTWIADGAPAN